MWVDISLGYGSDPLPSYRYLRNRSCTINFKNTFTSGSLYLLHHVLIPPQHKSTSSRNTLFPRANLIHGPSVHMRRYGGLSPLDIFLDWPHPRGLQRFSHWGPLLLSAHCTPRRHTHNSS